MLDLPQTTAKLHNDFSVACGPGGVVSMTRALQISCNTAFADLGLKLGAKALQDQAAKFGFGRSIDMQWPEHPNFPNYGYTITRHDLDGLHGRAGGCEHRFPGRRGAGDIRQRYRR